MTFIIEIIKGKKKGKFQVVTDAAFCTLLKNTTPDKDKQFTELISEFDKEIWAINPSISPNALGKMHGDWYEWLLAIAAWNYCANHEDAHLALLTPKVTEFDISKLYKEKHYNLIQDLKNKVFKTSGVQLISSNPDFVIIDRELVNRILPKLTRISIIDVDVIRTIKSAFKKFEFKCSFEDIHGYIGVKSSFRPDRRLQIPHEGSLMKAIYTHLQTREWIINPRGIKYYAMSTEITNPDLNALRTVATHSITTVHSIPQAAVDMVFEVNSFQQAEIVFDQVLSILP